MEVNAFKRLIRGVGSAITGIVADVNGGSDYPGIYYRQFNYVSYKTMCGCV